MILKKAIVGGAIAIVVGFLTIVIALFSIKAGLPKIMEIKDYEPLLVSQVYDRNEKKIGEFFRERRTLVDYDKIPKQIINAFLAAEDDQFFKHGGINYLAILRAGIANIRAGKNVQGGSTITQQVAKTFFLSPEKTIFRKIREAMLAMQLEDNLSKEEILYLYLNQIFFGNTAYGIENAAQTYFRKSVDKLTLEEGAILAGLPQAPSRYSPVKNPKSAKERQTYVLNRMADVGFISKDEAAKAIQNPVKVYVRENYEEFAPYYLETIRQILVQQLGEETVLDKGIRIYTGLDIDKQKAAQESVLAGLKQLDKRQGYRGALRKLETKEDIEKFLTEQQKKLISNSTPDRTILPNGEFEEIVSLKKLNPDIPMPTYFKLNETYEALVTEVNDDLGLVYLKLPESQAIIDFDSMKWARKPDANKRFDLDQIKKPSEALHVGDVVLVKIIATSTSIARLSQLKPLKKGDPPRKAPDLKGILAAELDQEPIVEGALLSFDQQTQDVLAMVGGSNFIRNKNEFNRTLQAARQTGSSFKTIVYASALDKKYTPGTPIMDAPIVYEETQQDNEGQEEVKTWKPANHGKTFGGEIIFRNALVQSLNVPTVKIVEDIGVKWSTDYARRLGIFSPLNPDFTMALGSSGVTLYEMTKVFSEFGRLGKRIRPLLIHKVTDPSGKVLLEKISLDERFKKEIETLDQEFDERRKVFLENKPAADPASAAAPPSTKPDAPLDNQKHLAKNSTDEFLFFDDPDQLIRPQTASVMNSLLRGVVEDKNGTGGRAKSLGREVAGKTGTTNGYVDAWFIGYTTQITTGVWVGFDKEKSMGKGEVGGRAALPLWLDYMKSAHEGLPQMTLPVSEGIVFANIDGDSGQLASASSKNVLRQAFIEGTEPTSTSNKNEEATEFLKQELNE
ncbi:MAG: PBP1A family penicillin-binding protein [Bdellovibrionota bacterium]